MSAKVRHRRRRRLAKQITLAYNVSLGETVWVLWDDLASRPSRLWRKVR